MAINVILFLILAATAVLTAVGMLLSRNAVYSALFLVLNFATVAVFYLLLGAPLIAMAQVTVYAGAIMVLFLFVIMLLGVEELRGGPTLVWQAPLAIVLALVLAVEAGYLVFVRAGIFTQLEAVAPDYANPTALGTALFQQYLLPIQITGVLLLVAMIGAIVLTKDEKQEKEEQQ